MSKFLDFSGAVEPIQHHRKSANILCLSGGGFRGIFTARVLAKLEAARTATISDYYDLIAGTSTGSLIAAALALGVSAKKIEDAYAEAGPRIFVPRWHVPIIKLPRLSAKVSSLFVQSPYRSDNLRDAIRYMVGEDNAKKSLAKLDIPFIAISLRHGDAKTQVLGAGRFSKDSPEMSLEDALVSSTAAPTYFPTFQYNNTSMLDGGLTANAPELIALSISKDRLGLPLDCVRMLSVGTAAPSPGVVAAEVDSRSTLRWLLSKRGLVQLTLAAQESLAYDVAKALVGANYLRIDRSPSSAQAKIIGGLDNASPASREVLLSLAEEAWTNFSHDSNAQRFLHS